MHFMRCEKPFNICVFIEYFINLICSNSREVNKLNICQQLQQFEIEKDTLHKEIFQLKQELALSYTRYEKDTEIMQNDIAKLNSHNQIISQNLQDASIELKQSNNLIDEYLEFTDRLVLERCEKREEVLKKEIAQLTEKIRARDALIVNLTIQNNTNSAPPPYSA